MRLSRREHKNFYSMYDGTAFDMGLPDKFTYGCCSKYLWDNGKYTLKKVQNHFCHYVKYVVRYIFRIIIVIVLVIICVVIK